MSERPLANNIAPGEHDWMKDMPEYNFGEQSVITGRARESALAGFIEGLKKASEAAERSESYEPTSRIGKLLKAVFNKSGDPHTGLSSDSDKSNETIVKDEIPRGPDGRPIYHVSHDQMLGLHKLKGAEEQHTGRLGAMIKERQAEQSPLDRLASDLQKEGVSGQTFIAVMGNLTPTDTMQTVAHKLGVDAQQLEAVAAKNHLSIEGGVLTFRETKAVPPASQKGEPEGVICKADFEALVNKDVIKNLGLSVVDCDTHGAPSSARGEAKAPQLDGAHR